MTLINEPSWIRTASENCERLLEKNREKSLLGRIGLTADEVRAQTRQYKPMRVVIPASNNLSRAMLEKDAKSLEVVDAVEAHMRAYKKDTCARVAKATGFSRLAVAGAIRRMIRAGYPLSRHDRVDKSTMSGAGASITYYWTGGN